MHMFFLKATIILSLLFAQHALATIATNRNALELSRFGLTGLLRSAVTTTATTQDLDNKHGPFYMDMPLDHFAQHTDNQTTFKNRYWVNADYYKTNGPIIFTNAGEASVMDASSVLVNSTMAQLTKRLSGIFIYMEHRFYGNSTPDVEDFDYSAETMSKLNTEQALADMTYLIQNVKFPAELNVPPVPETKVIVYGCSYSGNLAAWMRKTYPDVVFASVASSAPVEAQFNFYEYFNPIIRNGPKQCVTAIREVIARVDDILFGSSTENVQELKSLFGAEELYDDDFASLLTFPLAEFWQYGVSPSMNVFNQTICNKVFNSTTAANTTAAEKNLHNFAAFTKSYVKSGFCKDFDTFSNCLSTHNTTDIAMQKKKLPDNAAWMWQTCNEYGYFQVAAPHSEPTIVSRKLTTGLFERACQLYFQDMGVPARPHIDEVNSNYQGWHVQLDRVIWIDGEWDSWKELSVHSERAGRKVGDGQNVGSILIPRATHCTNYNGIDKRSPQYLVDIQDQQFQMLNAWLQNSSNQTSNNVE